MRKLCFTFILVFIITYGNDKAFCQDLLYKKDSTVVKAKIIEFNGKTITYKIPGDNAERTFYISKSLLDSLKYENGKVVSFAYALKIREVPQKFISRNYLGTDIINLIAGLFNLEYERLSKNGSTGFVTGILVNFSSNNSGYWQGGIGILEYSTFRPFYFFIRTGVNFYPFNFSLNKTSLARTSLGLYALTGSARKLNTEVYYDTGFKTNPAFLAIITWNVKERFYLGDNFEVSAGIETSLIPFLTFFNPHLSFSLSF
jgi:hypothetical protein